MIVKAWFARVFCYAAGMGMKGTTMLALASFATLFYTAFVAMCLWNWFATTAFNANTVSYFQMCGVLLLVRLLIEKMKTDEGRWEYLHNVLRVIAPSEKLDQLKYVLEQDAEASGAKLLQLILVTIIGNTIFLALGFALHKMS